MQNSIASPISSAAGDEVLDAGRQEGDEDEDENEEQDELYQEES